MAGLNVGRDMGQTASAKVNPQNFVTYNRGDMFFPSGIVRPASLLSMLATPFGQGGQRVHAIPLVYVRAKVDSRTMGRIGMVTPDYKG